MAGKPIAKPTRDLEDRLNKLIDTYMDEYDEAEAGWSTFSRTLRKSIPGKSQLKRIFLDNLGEMQLLAIAFKDDATADKITALLKAYK